MREMHNKDKIGELTQTLAELSIAERGEGIGTVSKNKTKVRVRCWVWGSKAPLWADLGPLARSDPTF